MVASTTLSFGQLAGLMGGSAGLGFAGNLLSSGLNSARAWKYAQRAMSYQDKLNRRFTRDQYGLMREGLTKADYNPLLALGGMSASTPSSAVGVGQSDSDNGAQAVASAMDAMRLRNETKLNKSTIDVNDSVKDLNTQQTYKTYADELKSRAEANVASATEAQIFNNINWDNLINDARVKQIMAETRYTNERSRGFSASSSKSYGGSVSPGFNFDKKKGKVGFGISGSGNYSSSESKSW